MAASYPEAFLGHLQPLLWVAGLEAFPSPPADADPSTPVDPFVALAGSLRRALASKRGFHIWNPSRGTAPEFHAVLVDKKARFAPRKADGGHSPISPLSPGSPLFPDGLMAPLWIRKHRELVPCVFVLVLRLWEPGSGTGDPLASGADAIEAEERAQDAELVREIAERKRVISDRGIKLAVVLLASRRLLDSPDLDPRLSLLRRQAGLDARASLFVLSPLPSSEVASFVSSLRAEIFPAAVDYYREHGRRARRKRSRVPTRSDTANSLSPAAWSVRYDYKAAVFAELRQELEVALKHYEDCYDGLVDLLAHATPSLAPRTKRWAEAKVLSDCISAKISKLYLYLDDPNRALAQLNKHVARFRDLCTRWDMGESTYEYWSWLSKQYRLFADVLDLAVRGGYRLPNAALNVAVPATSLGHPGHYYLRAGQCAIKRRDCFRRVASDISESASTSAALAHEQEVDHAEQIVELFTKAYELFKRHKASRQALALALAIANVHAEAGHHELALRFNERIQRTHRQEGWLDTLEPLLQSSFRAAVARKDGPTAIRTGVELLALARHVADAQRIDAAHAQLAEAVEITPAEGQSTVVSVDGLDSSPSLDCLASFAAETAVIGSNVGLDVLLRAKPDFSLSLDISAVRLVFGESHADILTEASADRRLALVDGQLHLAQTVSAPLAATVQLEAATLVCRKKAWTVEIPIAPVPTAPAFFGLADLPAVPRRPTCSFSPRSIRAGLDLQFDDVALLGTRSRIQLLVTNEDEQPLEIVCGALLQPGQADDDMLEFVGRDPSRTLQDVRLGVIEAGSTASYDLLVACATQSGPRVVDLVVRCSPAAPSSAFQATALEMSRSLVLEGRPALDAQVDLRWLKRMHVPRGMADFSKPAELDESWLAAISVRLTVASPWPIEIIAIRSSSSSSERFRVLSSSLADAQLPCTWTPRHRFGVVLTAQIAELHDTGLEDLTIDFRRAGTDESPASMRIALPSTTAPPLVPRVMVALPPSLTLHTPTPLAYRVFNPSRRRLLRLSVQLDGADQFVFAGPRRTGAFTVLPASEHVFRIVLIAVGQTGLLALPRLRVFEHVRPGEETQAERVAAAVADDQAPQSPAPVLRELPVVVEGDASGPTGASGQLTVMVVPA